MTYNVSSGMLSLYTTTTTVMLKAVFHNLVASGQIGIEWLQMPFFPFFSVLHCGCIAMIPEHCLGVFQ